MTRRRSLRPIAVLWAIAVFAAFLIGFLFGRTALAIESTRPAPAAVTFIHGSVQDPAMSRRWVGWPVRTPSPRPAEARTSIAGVASWYCSATSTCTAGHNRAGLFAAAGPRLRSALGSHWRGATVIVKLGHRQVAVKLVDWCACPHRLIDLYRSAFERLAPPSRGLLRVAVTWRAAL